MQRLPISQWFALETGNENLTRHLGTSGMIMALSRKIFLCQQQLYFMSFRGVSSLFLAYIFAVKHSSKADGVEN